MSNYKLCILGRLPPPYGGVTTFNKEIKNLLEQNQIEVQFLIGSRKFLSALISSRSKYFILSMSNRYLIIALGFLLRICNKKVAVIIHGDVERVNKLYARLVLGIRSVCHSLIVLNPSSLKFFKNPKKVTRFGTNLSVKNHVRLEKNGDSEFEYITYAHRFEIDAMGNEIYGIKFLYNFFNESNRKLTIVDPSNSYPDLINTENVKIIREPVDMINLFKPTAVYIRNTITDGDSLLIYEAVNNSSPVIASSCVERPKGIYLFKYSSRSDLELCISKLPEYSYPRLRSDAADWLRFIQNFCNSANL